MDLSFLWVFLGGWIAGIFLEYFLHWLMHRVPLEFHIGHHREFFHLAPRTVALRTIDPRLDIYFFVGALALFSPLMFWIDWRYVLLGWGGMFWHIVIVYELAHALLHHDAWLPGFFRNARPYRWWKGCHYEHHFHEPRGNYSVTCPPLDILFRTYIAPRTGYPELPHPKLKPAGDAIVVETLET